MLNFGATDSEKLKAFNLVFASLGYYGLTLNTGVLTVLPPKGAKVEILPLLIFTADSVCSFSFTCMLCKLALRF